jgi:hypothetical protein
MPGRSLELVALVRFTNFVLMRCKTLKLFFFPRPR